MDPPPYERASKMEGQRYQGDAVVHGVVARQACCPHRHRGKASDVDVVVEAVVVAMLCVWVGGWGARGDERGIHRKKRIVEFFLLRSTRSTTKVVVRWFKNFAIIINSMQRARTHSSLAPSYKRRSPC